jgi:Arc/MetJ-type ribon-helix-helix transcriptional regulator
MKRLYRLAGENHFRYVLHVALHIGQRAMTITVRLPDDMEANLRSRLAQLDVPMSEFVRQAIAEKLGREAESKPSAYEQGKHLFGKYSSGRSDLAENADEILREKLSAKHRR